MFPGDLIVHTQERPDIVIWSDTVKRVIIVELNVPWEENMEEAFERKKLRYENLRMECEDKGWACQVMPIEVGCRGFIGRTTTSYLTRLGLTNRARRRATQQLQTVAERASSWIWSKVRKSTTAWQNRPPSSLLPYPPPPPPPPPMLWKIAVLDVNQLSEKGRNSHYSRGLTMHYTLTKIHYDDVIMGVTASQITSLTIVYSTVYSGADQSKHQSSASLAFVWGIHRDRWILRTNGQ